MAQHSLLNGETKKRRESLNARGLSNVQILSLFVGAIVIASVAIFIVFEKVDPFDAVYRVLCSLLFAHCDESYQPITKIATILILIGTWTGLTALFEYGMDNFMKLEFRGRRVMKLIEQMNNHIIIVGYGALGKTVADTLEHAGADYVVIDKDPKIAAKLKTEDIPFLEGDALDTKTLKLAGIQRAKTIISALPSDADNVFLTLTAKEINPLVNVATRANNEQSIGKLHRAGAETIVMPEIIGGIELAKEVLGMDTDQPSKLVSHKDDQPASGKSGRMGMGR